MSVAVAYLSCGEALQPGSVDEEERGLLVATASAMGLRLVPVDWKVQRTAIGRRSGQTARCAAA